MNEQYPFLVAGIRGLVGLALLLKIAQQNGNEHWACPAPRVCPSVQVTSIMPPGPLPLLLLALAGQLPPSLQSEPT